MNRLRGVAESAEDRDWASGKRGREEGGMSATDVPRDRAVRRIGEGVVATVLGGLILWSVTSSMSRGTRTAERTEAAAAPAIQPTPAPTARVPATATTSEGPAPRLGVKLSPLASIRRSVAPAVQPTAAPNDPSLAKSMTSKAPEPRVETSVSAHASSPGVMAAARPPEKNLLPFSVPVGSILLCDNLSRYREGDSTDWGPNASVKRGSDRRNWLVSRVAGAHPVGRRLPLPNEFYFECRYSAYTPEITRGILGWWKEPVSTRFSFLNDRGAKYTIQWVIKYGNDVTRLNPLGSPSLYAKKYYHTIELPDGASNEVGVLQPTGVLRIDRDNKVVKVFVDGQAAVVGTMNQIGPLDGFEIDVVNAGNGSLSFTDFKIAR